MMRSTRTSLAAICVVLGLAPAAARAQKPPEVVVGQAIQAMSEVTRNPKTGMPRLVMRKAEGIAIIPSMFKAGFVIGARFGRGVLLVRQPDGAWSNPVFIHLVGGSFGAQVGAQKTDLILVFQSRRGLDRIIRGRDKLTLGVDVGAAAGPVGKRFEAGTDVAMKSEILSYSNSRGVFAGVSAEGGTLQVDWRANMNYYGRPASVGEILSLDSTLPVPAEAASLQAMLAEKTALPVPVGGGVVVSRGTVVEGDPIILENDGEETIIEGAVPKTSSRSVRSTPSPRTRPRVVRPEPGDDEELDPLPEAKPGPSPSTRANDEDLPTAIPDAKPARPRPAEPKPRPAPDDDVPALDPPKS